MRTLRITGLILKSTLQRMRALVAASAVAGILLGAVLIILVSVVFSFDSPIQLGYIDNDTSAVSADFERYLTQDLGVELVTGEEGSLQSQLVDKKISAIVEVPAGFEQALLTDTSSALLVTYMDDYANRAFLQSYFEAYTSSVQVLAAYAQGDASSLKALIAEARSAQASVTTLQLDEQLVLRRDSSDIFVTLFGFFVMISALITVGMANIVFEDRANRTYQRVQVSGVSAASYVIGVCAAGFIAAIIMVLIYMVFCLANGLGDFIAVGPILVMSLLFTLFCVGFALVVGLISKTRMACLWLILSVSTIFCLLGGAYFPIEYAPQTLQQFAHITPQFWLVDGVRQLAAGNADAWLLSSGILSLFALLCFLVAGIRFASRQATSL
ncbi:MAG: ABC transporter permease [Coriobacteriia bacterium]|nr:ABC transporter permease [Coriobacteriia bacterium]